MLRSLYLSKRREISIKKKEKWDLLISDHLFRNNNFIGAKTIHVYVSIRENKEVDTIHIIKHSIMLGKSVVVPKISENSTLDHIEIESVSELKLNKWGIPEPEGGRKVQVNELDLIIVPMVAGDRNRNRLGYGKGYYDRFLENSNAFKIGLLYDLQMYPQSLPVEPFDVSLDLLLTESQQI